MIPLLPEAPPAIAAAIRAWMEGYAACVRARDFEGGRAFWHPDVIAFGTRQRLERGIDSFVATQWHAVWPRTAEFRFDLDAATILASADGAMAVAIAPWTSTGFGTDGQPFDRPGRATLVLTRGETGWRCVHSHLSLDRGVPQESHGRAR